MYFQPTELHFGAWQEVFLTVDTDKIISSLDMFVTCFVVYKWILLVKGTKTVQMLKGIAVLIVLCTLSETMNLQNLFWLMNQVVMYGVIVAVVIFQPELRRGLEILGRKDFFFTSEPDQYNEELILIFDKAIQYLSKKKIGALITVERGVGLDEYIETGIILDANVSAELLVNIFTPNTPLHDGAVIVRKEKVAVASAYLPLSEDKSIPKELGTRHRAAVGIAEVSDAVTIVVSEETGDVSLTVDNELFSRLTREEYMRILREVCGSDVIERFEELSLKQTR